jgi:hypothetical protein
MDAELAQEDGYLGKKHRMRVLRSISLPGRAFGIDAKGHYSGRPYPWANVKFLMET